MRDIRQSINYKKYLESQGWIVERIDNINYFIRKLPLIGSVLKIQRPENIDFETIQKLEKKYKVFQTIIEPDLGSDIHLLVDNGYKLSKSPFLPSKTILLDLTKSEKQIWEGFKKDAKYGIRRGDTNCRKRI